MVKDLICVCCGRKLTPNDRYCPNCGENNEDYVEVVEMNTTTSTIINQSIKKVPINPFKKTTTVSNNVILSKPNYTNDGNTISNRLIEFVELYNIIEPLKDNRLKEYVKKAEEKFLEQDELFYFYLGKFLERILKKIKYDKSTAFERKQTTHEMFCLDLDNKLFSKNVEYDFLKSKNIYSDWMKKFTKKDGTEYSSFKADLADIILKTNLIDNHLMYTSFIDDAFNLYSLRTSVNHDDDNSINVGIEKEKLKTLVKVTRVLFQLI